MKKLFGILLSFIYLSSFGQSLIKVNQVDTNYIQMVGHAPNYFYPGSSFKNARVNIALNNQFTSRTSGTLAPIHLMFLGDSRLGYSPLYLHDAVAQYGNTNSIGFIGPYANLYGSAVTFSQTGTFTVTRNDNTSAATWGIAAQRMDMTATSTWSVQPISRFPFDKLRVFYNKSTTAGVFTVTIDGGSPVTVTATHGSGADSLGTYTLSSGLNNQNSHTVLISWVSGAPRIYGMECENQSEPGFVVDIIQSGASQALQWDGSLAYTKQYVAATSPAVFSLWLDVNDALSSRTASQYITNINNIVSQLSLPAQCATVMFTRMPKQTSNGSGVEDVTVDDLEDLYRAQLLAAVQTQGYSVFDLRNYVPPFSYWVSQSLFSDDRHPTINFAPYFWAGWAAAIMPVFNSGTLSGNFINNPKLSILIPPTSTSSQGPGFGVSGQGGGGGQTEPFTGYYAKISNSTPVMYYQQGGVELFRIGSDGTTNTQLFTLYPTSTFNTILEVQREGTPATNAYKIGIDASNNFILSNNNAGDILSPNTFMVNNNANTLAGGTFIANLFTPNINQSSSAGYTGMGVYAFENATGSGTKLIAAWGTSSLVNGGGSLTNLATLTNGGIFTATSLAASGNNAIYSSGTFQSSNLAITGTGAQQATDAGLEPNSTAVYIRDILGNGGSTASPIAGNAYINTTIGDKGAIALPATSTTPELGQLYITALPAVTNASSIPLTLTYTLKVGAASSAGTTNLTAEFMTGDTRFDNGNLILNTAGNEIKIKEGTNAAMGTGTLAAGTLVVSTTKVTANSRIFVVNEGGGTLANYGTLYISARSAGTSFTVSSTNVLDTATFSWVIVEPAP